MHVRDKEVKSLITMSAVMDKLAELGREVENVVRFVAVEISKENKLGFRVLHF